MATYSNRRRKNIRQAYEWVKEKQSEAAEAQWNRELILLREIQNKIKEIAKGTDDLISLEDAVKMLLEDVDALDSRTLNNLKSIQILKHITKLDNERME
jgi:translation initiation factor 2B subunit (eIF-2B alpha/beta/delta family)